MFVKLTSLWIEGTTHAGKTTQLVKNFFHWVENRCYKQSLSPIQSITQNLASSVLVLSANDDNRRKLFDKLSSVSYGGGDAGGGNVTTTFDFITFNKLAVSGTGTVSI